jgi:uncharacterized protein
MKALWTAAALALLVSTSLAQTSTVEPPPQEPKAKPTFLVIYRPGPAWLVDKPVTEQPLKEHGKYMLSLYAAGTLKFAGPFTDNAGGALAFEATDEAEARAIVAKDPAVVSGVFIYELHPWRLVEWERYLKK